MVRSDIAIITAYNDMLSAHQPYEHYPQRLKQALQAVGAVGRGRRRAGDVRRRDAGAGRHGAVADEPRRDRHVGRRRPVAQHVRRCAVPRHLRQDRARAGDGRPLLRPPARAVRACRPDEQRFTQQRKVRVRQLYAEGKADRPALLEAEAASYHGIGTCTFYGTANTNQMVMEVMGLHLPGASFVHPDTPLRDALNDAAARR